MEELRGVRFKQRGSASILAMIMVVATATLAIAMISLSTALREKQTRLEANRIVSNAWDGGVETIRDMAARGVLRLPQTVSATVGNVTESLALADASSGSISLLGINLTVGVPTILITGTLTYNGNTYKRQQVIGRGKITTPWQYAIFENNGLTTLTNSITTGASGLGDCWFNGSITLLGAGTSFTGDLTSTGLILPLGLAVTGTTTASAPALTFPSVSNSTYQTAALINLSGNQTISGYTFFAADPNGYRETYINGNLTIKGNIVGSGVFFVNGNVTISGDITKASSDHCVIITAGNITIGASANNIAAYLYCGNTLSFANSNNRTFTGGMVVNNLSLSCNIAASFDTDVRDNQNEAWKLKLPGCWP